MSPRYCNRHVGALVIRAGQSATRSVSRQAVSHFEDAAGVGGLGSRVLMLAAPSIQFAVRHGHHLAYQVAGQGPLELVYVGGSVALSQAWEEPSYARGLRRLASFSRLITYDQRGMGYSDPIDRSAMPTLEDLVSDLAAVMDAAGVTRPVLFGSHNGGAVAAAYAAAHPIDKLVLCNTWARLAVADDYPIGFDERILDDLEARYEREWGMGRITDTFAQPRAELVPERYELASTSRNQAVVLFQMNRSYDIRHLLSSIDTPTLVIHLRKNFNIPPAFGTFIAEAIPDARLALVPGTDQFFLRNDAEPVIDEVERFLTGMVLPFTDGVVTTMLFTDIVDSTPLAASLGDQGWSSLIHEHNDRGRRQIRRYGGHEVKNTGDGFLAAFDETPQALRCAHGIIKEVAGLGLQLRAGVHLGEVSRMGKTDLSGFAVHFAQRLCGQAMAGQVLTSRAVVEACRDSGISFEDEGTASLKGVRGETDLYSAHLESP